MHSEVEKAYLAGLIDGEGSIGIDAHGGLRVPSVRITITNSCIDVLEEMAGLWGGAVTTRRRRVFNWKETADLRIGAKTAVDILKEIQPYLKIKRGQCQVALDFGKTVNPRKHRTKRLSPDVVQHREELRQIMLELNQRGYAPTS